jgi:hypothetical protein
MKFLYTKKIINTNITLVSVLIKFKIISKSVFIYLFVFRINTDTISEIYNTFYLSKYKH